jgi:hypothetical protein
VSTGTGAPSPQPDGGRDAPEQCPICGAPLREEQDWCLRCGTAARTRLAPAPRWRVLVISLLVVAVLSLAGLTAALVKLTGGSGGSGSASGAGGVTTPPPAAVATTTPAITVTTSSPTAVTTSTSTAVTVPSGPTGAGTGATAP